LQERQTVMKKLLVRF